MVTLIELWGDIVDMLDCEQDEIWIESSGVERTSVTIRIKNDAVEQANMSPSAVESRVRRILPSTVAVDVKVVDTLKSGIV